MSGTSQIVLNDVAWETTELTVHLNVTHDMTGHQGYLDIDTVSHKRGYALSHLIITIATKVFIGDTDPFFAILGKLHMTNTVETDDAFVYINTLDKVDRDRVPCFSITHWSVLNHTIHLYFLH